MIYSKGPFSYDVEEIKRGEEFLHVTYWYSYRSIIELYIYIHLTLSSTALAFRDSNFVCVAIRNCFRTNNEVEERSFFFYKGFA